MRKEKIGRSLFGFLLAFVMVIGLMPGMSLTTLAADAYGGGDGTENNPYAIETLEHLKLLQQSVSNGTNYQGVYFILKNSIDLEGAEWTPIGTATCTPSDNSWPISDEKPFRGIFDGNNNMITGLSITGEKNVQGLFGYVGVGGEVKNLTVSGSVKGNVLVGGIVGYNKGTVSGCHNQVAVAAKGLFHDTGNRAGGGGVVGTNDGTVKGCSNSGLITGITKVPEKEGYYKDGTNIGGVVGGNVGTVTECWNTGTISAAGNTGGVLGANYGTLSKCYNAGEVAGTSWSVAGLLGINRYGGAVENCYNTGTLKSTGVGNSGIVGTQQSYDDIKNCYNYGTVELGDGENYGLIIGTDQGMSPSSCYYPANLSSGNLNEVGGSQLSDEQFAKKESFSGWDFSNVWYLDNGVRPLLKATPEAIPSKPTFEYDGEKKKLKITVEDSQDITIHYTTDGKRPEVTSDTIPNGETINDLSGGKTINIIVMEGKAVKLSTSYDLPYTVTFNTNGGSTVESQTVAGGEKATSPDDPTKGDCVFDGWYTDTNFENEFDFNTPITEDITLHAKWKEAISKTVIFRVVNGSWDNGTSKEKTVTLNGYEGDTLKLAADQIPAVGTKPDDGHKAGNWDVTPNTETAIVENTTYTYTYEQKGKAPANVEKPTAVSGDDAVYTGTPITLLDTPVPVPEGYTKVQYKLEGESTWRDEVPSGTKPGVYKVQVKYTSDLFEDIIIDGIRAEILPDIKDVSVDYVTHIQNKGWEKEVKKNGEVSGTTGSSLRMEAIAVKIEGNPKLGVQYATHVENLGWTPWAADGEIAGTTSEGKRMEAIMLKLTGADKDKYDIHYRVHAQNYGWLNWAKNGEPAGTSGHAYRLEAIQIVVVPKGTVVKQDEAGVKSTAVAGYISKDKNNAPEAEGVDTVNVSYRAHIQNAGWQNWKSNGAVAGTYGRSLRLEGINIKVTNKDHTGGIRYKTHIQNLGWEKSWHVDGDMAGTTGRSLRLEAIDIELYGDMATYYDVYYRVHAQNYGWMGWAKNGEHAGTTGMKYRLEGIQVVIVPKGSAAPADSYGDVKTVTKKAFLSK